MSVMCYLKFLFFFGIVLQSHWLTGQCVNAPADNMTCYYRFDDDDVTSSSGGLAFNDIWGYVDESGNEFAILGGFDSIYIFDVTDPINTFQVAADDPPGTSLWRDFKVSGHYMYAVADQGTTGLRVYDMDSLTVGKLHLVGSYTSDFVRTHNIFIDEAQAKLYVAGSNTVNWGLLIYDLSSDSKARNPLLINAFEFDTLVNDPGQSYYIHDIFVRNDTAYCSHGYKGYYIWDLTDPVNPDSSDLIGFIDNFGIGTYYVHSS